jgi:glycosyltransferase involved in cell wall biosynthesis
MSELRIILTEAVSASSGRLGRYTEELARALIDTAPRGSHVAGVIAASPESDYDRIAARLPGLAALYKSPLAAPQLAAAWQHGFTRLPGSGMVHAPSLLAPLFRHDRLNHPGDQTVVTIHDAVAWTHPELLAGRRAAATRTMGRRAERYADAVVVPTHAVAEELADHLRLGDRIRVISGASTVHATPLDAVTRERLRLPGRYLLGTADDADPGASFASLIGTLATRLPDVDLVVVVADAAGTAALRSAADGAGVTDRVHAVHDLDAADLGSLFGGAAVFVQPGSSAGSGASMLDAFAAGLPVVHSDAAGFIDLAADAGVSVPLETSGDDGRVLADAVRGILDDAVLGARLRTSARDRSLAFDWRDAAEKTWQLHADL